MGIIDLERLLKLDDWPSIFENVSEPLLVNRRLSCYGRLKCRLCMLTDEVKALGGGMILDDPIKDFSSWLGRYENEIGFRSALRDYVFFRPLLSGNLYYFWLNPLLIMLKLSLSSTSDAVRIDCLR